MGFALWPWSAWVCWGGAVVLGSLAILLVFRGLWRDKGFKTRRCPKCWYEMTGVPGLRCPECGHEAKTEKGLFKRRRSRWAAAVGLTLLVIAGGLALWPKVSRDGWWSVTPRVVLIMMWPRNVPEWQPPSGGAGGGAGGIGATGLPPGWVPMGSVPLGWPGGTRTALDAVEARLDVRGLDAWERRLLAGRCAAELRLELAGATKAPNRAAIAMGWLELMGADAAPALEELIRMAQRGKLAQRHRFASPTLDDRARTKVQHFFAGSPAGAVHNDLSISESAERFARAYVAAACGISVNSAAAGRMAELLRDDPMLLDDRAAARLAADPEWRPRVIAGVLDALTSERDDTDRCRHVLVRMGPALKDSLLRLLEIALGRQWFATRVAAFEAIASMGPGVPEAEAALREVMRTGDTDTAFLAAFALARRLHDEALLIEAIIMGTKPDADWAVRWEAVGAAGNLSEPDPRVLDRLFAATQEAATLMQALAAESIAKLAIRHQSARDLLLRVQTEGGPRAQDAAKAAWRTGWWNQPAATDPTGTR